MILAIAAIVLFFTGMSIGVYIGYKGGFSDGKIFFKNKIEESVLNDNYY